VPCAGSADGAPLSDSPAHGVGAGRLTGRQIRDDLAVALGAILHLLERFVDRRKIELHPEPVQAQTLLDVGAEPVLFVLGEHGQHRRVELVVDGGARTARHAGTEPIELVDQLLEGAHGVVGLVALGGQDLPEHFDAAEEHVEGVGGELHPAEPEIVEDVLQPVRELTHLGGAEQPGQTLQGVDGAKRLVHERRIGRAFFQRPVEREQIPAQRLDDLLSLREELLASLVGRLCHLGSTSTAWLGERASAGAGSPPAGSRA
jgi:hypothetical protein